MKTMFNATSYSEYKCYARCPMQYKFNYVYRLQPKRKSVALTDGIIAHQLLMRGYIELREGLDPFDGVRDEAFQLSTHDSTLMMFDDELADYQNMVNECERRVIRYFEKYNDDWEILHVEETFVVMNDSDVVSFTPDLVIRQPDGTVWVVDHKNVTSLPDELPFADMQAALYIAGVRAIYPDCVGFIWNYLRKKEPRVPELVKDGSRIADVNRIDTTYEMLRDAMLKYNLMDLDSHRARLLELQNQEKFFRRMEYFITPEFENSMLEDLQQLRRAMQSGYYFRAFSPSTFDGCNRCGYNVLCKAELQGNATPQLIEEWYEPLDLSHRDYETEE